jgi:Ca2+-binding EF-hand superfamily protein
MEKSPLLPMKKTVLSLGLCSATLFLAAGRAEEAKAPPPAARDAGQAGLLQRFDTNHDGKLDEAELAAAHESMLQAGFGNGAGGERRSKREAWLLKHFDKNGDGKLDESERAEAKRVMLARFDTNHDGRLDEDERAAMREQLKGDAKALKLKN